MRAFASSLGPGCTVESFTGRSVLNCRTEDDPFSFFGVDLGPERRLLPTHYTLRNRNSTSHVVRNWNFEGSVDAQNWSILDVRVYHTDNPGLNAALDNEFKELRTKGGSMTFQIDTEVYRQLGIGGYRFFRVV